MKSKGYGYGVGWVDCYNAKMVSLSSDGRFGDATYSLCRKAGRLPKRVCKMTLVYAVRAEITDRVIWRAMRV